MRPTNDDDDHLDCSVRASERLPADFSTTNSISSSVFEEHSWEGRMGATIES